MKAVLGLTLLFMAGFLFYEVASGNALTIIKNFRPSTDTTTSKSIQDTPQDVKQNNPNQLA